MVNWTDLAPTILDFCGVEHEEDAFHGHSFLEVLDRERSSGWDSTFASHTFHEITMYYPMRVLHERRYKLIWNIAHGLPYPFASDLWEAPTWQATLERDEESYGRRSVEAYLQQTAVRALRPARRPARDFTIWPSRPSTKHACWKCRRSCGACKKRPATPGC